MNDVLLAKCSCVHCGNHIEFPLEAADMRVACPHCNVQTQLTLEAPPAPSSGKPTAAELLAGFNGTITPPRTSFLYHVGLLLVTVMMLILPVIYVALVGVAAWGVYLYATHFTFLVTSMHGGRLYLLQLLAYLGPLFAGAVLVLFMVKPIFAGRAPKIQPLCLNPAAESTLYAFIARICELVGAPMPKRIYLDCQLNAAASFRRGFASMLGHDLALTVGVPLVASLSLREFAGVIAHEFGHFTQGFGMRLSYVIRSINGWFARVVYERDAWDVTLEAWAGEAEDWRIALVIHLARFGVFITRMILMLLMFVGHGVSCFLLRQMEYDADAYEIRLAGSAAFESTAKRMAVLNAALGTAYKEMRAKWNLSRNLPENFPAYMLQHHARMAPGEQTKIEDTLGLAKTGLLDTHPSDGDRIRRARRAGDPGIFHLELPASVLFSHFEGACRQITLQHYAEDLGIPPEMAKLQPMEVAA